MDVPHQPINPQQQERVSWLRDNHARCVDGSPAWGRAVMILPADAPDAGTEVVITRRNSFVWMTNAKTKAILTCITVDD